MPEIKIILEEKIKKRKLKVKETWKEILMTGLQFLEEKRKKKRE